jgi:uncharacterized RDD family membrane protein YckC
MLGIRVVSDESNQAAPPALALREAVFKPGLLLFGVGPVVFFGGIALVAGSPTNILRELFSVIPGPWWSMLLLAPILMAVGLVGFLSMTWDLRQRGWHDKAAGTRVIRSA